MVASWELVRALLEVHPEYGNSMGGQLSGEPGVLAGELKTVSTWIREIYTPYDPGEVSRGVGPMAFPHYFYRV